MSEVLVPPLPGADARSDAPPLMAGDHLSRPEFERRYLASPHVKKAELVEGIVFMPSPSIFSTHAAPHGKLSAWVGLYAAKTPGVDFAIEPTVRLDLSNEPQPDVILRWLPEHGGQSRVDESGYLTGPPDLAVEISASSASYDMHRKKRAYERNGVREYLVWLTCEKRVLWFGLRDGEYATLEPDSNGVLKSAIFPGLWLDVKALLENDFARVMDVLDQGVTSRTGLER